MGVSRSVVDFRPLIAALQQVEHQVELTGQLRVLVASRCMEDFMLQELASQNRVVRRPLQGPRVAVRGRHHADQPRTVLARWPKDHLLEAALPSLLFVLRGQADIRVSDYSVCCWPGDSILIPAGIPKSDGSVPDYVDMTPESTCDILLFSPGLVYGEGLECSIGHSRGDQHIAGDIDEGCWLKQHFLAQLYAGLCEELQERGNSKSTYHLLMLLVVQLRREIEEGRALKGWQFSSLPLRPVKLTPIRQAMKYIHQHLSKPLTIDFVARQIGISRTAFTRDFRRETGDSFKNYLTDQRLKQAEVLLRDAKLPVKRVSGMVGLSPGRLRHLFRQRNHCTPDEFRKSVKKCP